MTMRQRSSFPGALLLCLLVPAMARAGDVPAPEDLRPVREKIEEGIREGLAPSLAVAVVKEGRVVWAEGFGLGEIASGRRATADSIYLLASVSKPITATGLMLLVDRGKVDLDRPANDYLPGAKLRAMRGAAEAMTIRRLANHTAGFGTHYSFFYEGSTPPSWDETIRRWGFAAWAPGSRWHYSNLAFGLLGRITETVSGRPWRELLESELFDPLGMKGTSDRVRPERAADGTVQYTRDASGRWVKVEPYGFDHPGASAIWSSASDLARFALFHLNGGELDGVRLLREESARAMQRARESRGPESRVGIGWFLDDVLGKRCYSHSGGMPGVSTLLRVFPEQRAAAIVLNNSDDGTMTRRISDLLARALLAVPEEPERPRRPESSGGSRLRPERRPEASLAPLAGVWEGRWAHFEGDIPLRLEVSAAGEVEVSLGARRGLRLEEPRFREGEGGSFGGRFQAPLRVREGFHGLPHLGFDLLREGERLAGVGAAWSQGYFEVPFWVELERKGGRPAEGKAGEATPRYDVIIRGGRIVDGTGAPWYRADLAILDGRIAAIGRLEGAEAGQAIDAAGMAVAPGFIDLMGQTARPFLADRSAGMNLLTQGITTINAGEGDSDAPLDEERGREAGWRTMAEFFEKLERSGLPLNVAQTVGHTQVRSLVVGEEDRKATPEELERMKALVREAMEAGAIGLSTSLIYPPAVYAPEEEILELARVAGEHGGRYFTHMRNEGDRLLEAIDEALRIGKGAGAPVHIFHLKTAGRANWGKMDLALARIRAARAAGQEVAADIYPYVNNGLGLRAFLHPRHAARGPEDLSRRLEDPAVRAEMQKEMEETGGWENWFAHAGRDWDRVVLGRIEHPAYSSGNGKSLGAIARVAGKDPWEVFFEIARAGAFAMPETMSEANKVKAMREEFITFDTDVGPAGGSTIASHPRGWGSFPRILSRYVRELGVLSLEAAVHRMTAAAANEVLARDRGRLAPGLAADVVVFDPDRIGDAATFGEPDRPSTGVRAVIVNGAPVLIDGKYTGAAPGKVLRGPGARR